MAGYFGTEAQQRLQALAEANADFVRTTAGACQTGRMMGCDDLDRFGWERIDEILERDGLCGFRLIPAGRVLELRSHLSMRNFRFDTWEVFLADRAAALPACDAVMSKGLPPHFSDLPPPVRPEDDYTVSIQALMGAAGVVPFSGSMLIGTFAPATTAVVGDAHGEVVATAHGYLPHNAHSPHHDYAWGGLVAVAGACRGKGLGAYVNARLVASAFADLRATHVYELISPLNLASQRMVMASGLRHEPSLVCGVATRIDSAHFTR